MSAEGVLAALRRPLTSRIPFRRSTAIMVGLFVVLAGLHAYHGTTKPPATSFVCTSERCYVVNHPSGSGTPELRPLSTSSTTTGRSQATVPPTTGAATTSAPTAGPTTGEGPASGERSTTSSTENPVGYPSPGSGETTTSAAPSGPATTATRGAATSTTTGPSSAATGPGPNVFAPGSTTTRPGGSGGFTSASTTTTLPG